MYHPVKIEPLSKPQVAKLLKGQPVRVKKGSHHAIHVSSEQHKKLAKASLKGSGITLTFDPYQCEMHSHMHGEGVFSKLKSFGQKALSKAKDIYTANESRLAPLKDMAKAKAKELATSKLREYGEKLAPHVADRFGDFGSKALQQGLQMGEEHIAGQGLHRRRAPLRGKGIKERAIKFGRSALKGARDIGRKVAPLVGSLAGAEFGPLGSIAGAELAKRLAGGKLKRGKKHGGALFAAGYGGGFDSEDEC